MCIRDRLKLLTPGAFDVIKLYRVSQEDQTCHFQASPDDAKSRYLYRQKFGQPELERLTPADQSGWHEYSFAADGSSAVHTWSSFGIPATVNTISLPDHKQIAIKEDNTDVKKAMANLLPGEQEFFKVDIDDGNGGQMELDAWVMKPHKFDASKKYPVVVYVYLSLIHI